VTNSNDQNLKPETAAVRESHLMPSWLSLPKDGLFLSFDYLDLGFVSDFEIRNSDLLLSSWRYRTALANVT
jgi:hypothetical protein